MKCGCPRCFGVFDLSGFHVNGKTGERFEVCKTCSQEIHEMNRKVDGEATMLPPVFVPPSGGFSEGSPLAGKKSSTPFRNSIKVGLSYDECVALLNRQEGVCSACGRSIQACCGKRRAVVTRDGDKTVMVGADCFRGVKAQAKAQGVNVRKAVW
jgi:hypothetical protein